MAEMDLRAYIKEIDDLIERNQLDEAIAHCRQILQVYPKHLGSYRLLGKAYLEVKRFGDAADIFQRVLSAIPDDFVSHIGMAIVREDEGNLDSAIWHMERAFETNPANPAIRQELSRLIGRRDGLEPHKIRLTRGALARQYAQGELYLQAIAELRSALGEDPDRPDLEVLLGKMYWLADQHAEAKDVFGQILEKLPYCLEANRYMTAIFQEENNTEEASTYHRHLAALDPYFAFVESATTDPMTIDAKAVRIERSDWVPGQPLPTAESGPPEWVASLGVDLSEAAPTPLEADDTPSWMAEIEQGTTPLSSSPAVLPDSSEIAPDADPEGEIPEWMEEAGWVPSSGEVEEGPISFSDAELEPVDTGDVIDETGELIPADIPGWIQEIAPENLDEPAEADEPVADPVGKADFMPDWLSDIASDAEQVTPDPISSPADERQEEAEPISSVEETPSDQESPEKDPIAEIDAPEVPTWIDEQAPGATSTIITWLDDRPGDVKEPEKAKLPSEAVEETIKDAVSETDVPSWLDEIADGDEIPELEAETPEGEPQSPSWLTGLAKAASQQDVEPGLSAADEMPEKSQDEATPDWLDGISEIEDTPAPAPSTDDAPDWLRGIAEPESFDSPVSPAEEKTKMPDWVSAVEEPADELSPKAVKPQDDVPDWLTGIADSIVERTVDEDFLAETVPEPEESAAEVRGEAPDWLQEFAGSAEKIADVESISDEPEIDIQSLQQLEKEIGSHAIDSSTPDTLSVTDEVDDDEVFRWLEDLAETHEAEEGMPEAPPADSPMETDHEPSPAISEAVPPEEADESLLWLENLATQRGIDVDVTPATPRGLPTEVDASLDWVKEMAAVSTDETIISKPPSVPTEEIDAEQIEDAASESVSDEAPLISAVAQETVQEEPMPEIPGWLDEAASVAEVVPPEPVEIDATPIDEEEIHPPEPTPVEAAPVAELTPTPEPIDEIIPTPVAAPHIPAAEEDLSEAEKVEPAVAVVPSKYKEPASQLLLGARQALNAGDAGRALSDYKKLIERKQDLKTVITDLEHALERYPNLPTMWQALGDAYMKADQLQEAIKAYQRGMEVA
ncbi:MAG: tetratricopeptide repeat protein [Anaerolineales bacterium]